MTKYGDHTIECSSYDLRFEYEYWTSKGSYEREPQDEVTITRVYQESERESGFESVDITALVFEWMGNMIERAGEEIREYELDNL